MFGALFQTKNSPYQMRLRQAEELYAQALLQTRNTKFYTAYGVPDTFDGRFDLLLIHLFLILNTMIKVQDNADLSQALFDVTFRDMDQTLREMGIGDMGVPKHMRRMMKAFNGRMHAYKLALEPDFSIEGLVPASLGETLRRNIYALSPDISDESVIMMENYIRQNADSLTFDQGKVQFAGP